MDAPPAPTPVNSLLVLLLAGHIVIRQGETWVLECNLCELLSGKRRLPHAELGNGAWGGVLQPLPPTLTNYSVCHLVDPIYSLDE